MSLFQVYVKYIFLFDSIKYNDDYQSTFPINNIMIKGYDKNKVDIIAIKGFSLHLKNIYKYYKITIDNEKIKELIDLLNDTSSAEDIKKVKDEIQLIYDKKIDDIDGKFDTLDYITKQLVKNQYSAFAHYINFIEKSESYIKDNIKNLLDIVDEYDNIETIQLTESQNPKVASQAFKKLDNKIKAINEIGFKSKAKKYKLIIDKEIASFKINKIIQDIIVNTHREIYDDILSMLKICTDNKYTIPTTYNENKLELNNTKITNTFQQILVHKNHLQSKSIKKRITK